jgi:Peptidase A4 family
MVNFSSHERVAALGLLAAVGLVAAPAQAEQPSTLSLKTHGPIEVHRRADGSLARGAHNEFVTSNWSGYAIAHYQSGQYYTSAQATWVVPTVTFGPTNSGTNEEYSATWVGIGGFCTNALCTRADRTLIQLGTSQYVLSSGATSYFAWYEMLPQAPVTITAITVSPGDQIAASLQCVSACSAKKQNWQLSITNNSTGQTWLQNFSNSSSRASADWIEEAPVSRSVLPLADFNVFGIAPSINNVSAWNSLTLSANGIQISDPWGQTSNPPGTDANGFNNCWGYGSMADCSVP